MEENIEHVDFVKSVAGVTRADGKRVAINKAGYSFGKREVVREFQVVVGDERKSFPLTAMGRKNGRVELALALSAGPISSDFDFMLKSLDELFKAVQK